MSLLDSTSFGIARGVGTAALVSRYIGRYSGARREVDRITAEMAQPVGGGVAVCGERLHAQAATKNVHAHLGSDGQRAAAALGIGCSGVRGGVGGGVRAGRGRLRHLDPAAAVAISPAVALRVVVFARSFILARFHLLDDGIVVISTAVKAPVALTACKATRGTIRAPERRCDEPSLTLKDTQQVELARRLGGRTDGRTAPI